MSAIKITINAPAKRLFIDPLPGEISYFRINISGGNMYFKPITQAEYLSNPKNTTRAEPRRRGGMFCRVEGSRANELQSALFNPSGLPFFLLQWADDGWIQCIPWTREGTDKTAPDRFVPHLRFWHANVGTAAERKAALAAQDPVQTTFTTPPGIERVRSEIRAVRAILDQSDSPGCTEEAINKIVLRAELALREIKPLPIPAKPAQTIPEQAAPAQTSPKTAPPVAAPAAAKATGAAGSKKAARPAPQPEPEVRAAMQKPSSRVTTGEAARPKGKVDLKPVAPAPERSTRKAGFDVNPKAQPQAQPVGRGGAGSRSRRLAVFGSH